ncbi:MoaB/Mog domain-containing protein [Gilbertella persicaria]|uniref:MoaB/Mog domain-containing protein n=1 Tax=Gilbertella persicaria TaxID=101096 RepID=UPI00221EFB35|nr:MoaB/Mog domain-containing protein [Gilbertella persicaria]KAI8073528.1 MoaB/Mog domain-containing protein [Gilbertella persicaria]
MTDVNLSACCIIGDEILSGKTQDTNSHYLAKTLFDIGIELKTIHVVGDTVEAITKSVKELSCTHDYVFTSGGIGPTHDDITYAAIASAFNLELRLDQPTLDYIQSQLIKRNQPLSPHHARMATFPFPATLLRETKIPVVIVQDNVYILPGIPRLFQFLVDTLRPKLTTGRSFYRYQITTSQPEVMIADTLTQFQTKHPDVKIGSYPVWPDQHVLITVTSHDKSTTEHIGQALTQAIRAKL